MNKKIKQSRILILLAFFALLVFLVDLFSDGFANGYFLIAFYALLLMSIAVLLS